jgi:probable rRNA maturation factor
MITRKEKDSHKIWKNDMLSVEAIIDESLWDKQLINDFQKNLNKISSEIYKNSDLININKKNHVSVSFAGDKKIIELNNLYRQQNLPTNVLSFPSLTERNNEIFLGDIIFSAETIFREAKRDKKSFKSHLIHLFIHGVLHLIGYDHQTENNAKVMENLEIKILETLKINNPYE